MLDKHLLFKSFSGLDDDLLLRSESNSYKVTITRKKRLGIFAAAISVAIGMAILFVALMLYGGKGSSMDGYHGAADSATTASEEASSGFIPNNIAPDEWKDNGIHYESGQDN